MKQSLAVFLAMMTAPTLVAAGPIDVGNVRSGQTGLADSRSLTVGDMAWRWDLAPTAAWLPYPTEFTDSTATLASMSFGLQRDFWGEMPMDPTDLLTDGATLPEAALSAAFWGRRGRLGDAWWCEPLYKVAPRLARRLGCGGGGGGGGYDPPVDPVPVPEPAALLLLGTGLAGVAIRQRRRA